MKFYCTSLTGTGLREATEGMIKKKKTKELTPWQEYLQKKEEKKMKKREERKKKSQAGGKVLIWPQGYKTFFMANSTEHEI